MQLAETDIKAPGNERVGFFMSAVNERLIVVVLFDGVELLDVTGPPEMFALLRREATHDKPGYRVVLAAETMDPVSPGPGCASCPTPRSARWPGAGSTP